MLDVLGQDVRFGSRLFWKSPGFTAAVVLCLALGIGPNTILFSIVNAILIRPLRVVEPEHLVEFHTRTGDQEYPQLSYPDYVTIRDRVKSLAGVAVTANAYLSVRLPGRAEVVKGAIVSSNFFDLLGRPAKLGEMFHAGDREMRPIVVLSYGFWQNELLHNPSIVGNTLTMNGYAFTVIGVMPESFTGTRVGVQPALWVPMKLASQVLPGTADLLHKQSHSWLTTFGRLAPGVPVEQVNEELDRVAAGTTRKFTAAALNPLPADQRRAVFPVTGLLTVVVGLVLLISCSSVSSLLLVRSLSRRREIAIRRALGASRGRLIRQLLTESTLLALLAGGVALLFTLCSLRLLVALLPPAKPMYIALDLSLDYRVFAFTLVVSLLTGLLFGLAPAIQASHGNLIPALKDQVAGVGVVFRTSRLRNVLIGFQLSLAVLLSIMAGLFIKDLRAAHSADPGFDAERLLVFDTNLSLYGYSPEKALQFTGQLADRLSQLPGVEAVTVARHPPLSPKAETADLVAPVRENSPSGTAIRTSLNAVGPGYFATVGIPVLKGRPFNERDLPNAPLVAIVNKTLAEKLWPGQEPIGRRFSDSDGVLTVVGVAGNSNYRVPGEAPSPHFYLPFKQAHDKMVYANGMAVVLRAKENASALAEAVRTEIGSLNPALAPSGLKPMSDDLDQALWRLQSASFLFGAFAVLALVLAVTGVYGVIAYSVQLRRFEIAIRMALGARPQDLVLLFVRQGIVPVLTGVTIGVLAAFGFAPFLRPFLSGASSTDLGTFLGIPLLLTMVALLAIYWPARRAARVDPMRALRNN